MKRFKIVAAHSIAAGVAAFAMLGAGAAHAQTVKVLSIVDHPALDAIRDGVRAQLKAEGYGDDKLKWEYQSAQGNTGTAAQIARKFIGDRPDVIVAIATPAAQAVVASTKTVPVVYSGVTDPVAAQLVKGWGPTGTNVTGVSDQCRSTGRSRSSSAWCRRRRRSGWSTTRARQTRSSS